MRPPTLLLAFGLFALQANAQTQGILMKGKDTRDGQSTVIEIRFGRNHLRMDLTVAGEPLSAVFDGTKQLFVQFNLNQKTYQEISKAEMDSVLTQSIRQTMPNPTPEQQARIDGMLRARSAMTPAAPPVPDFYPSSTDKVGEWPCTNFARPGGTMICTGDPAYLGLTTEDFAVLRQLEQFDLSLMGGMGSVTAAGLGIRSIFPVELLVEGTSEGKPFAGVVLKRTQGYPANPSVFEVTEIRRETFAPNVFEVPSGLSKGPITPVAAPR